MLVLQKEISAFNMRIFWFYNITLYLFYTYIVFQDFFQLECTQLLLCKLNLRIWISGIFDKCLKGIKCFALFSEVTFKVGTKKSDQLVSSTPYGAEIKRNVITTPTDACNSDGSASTNTTDLLIAEKSLLESQLHVISKEKKLLEVSLYCLYRKSRGECK